MASRCKVEANPSTKTITTKDFVAPTKIISFSSGLSYVNNEKQMERKKWLLYIIYRLWLWLIPLLLGPSLVTFNAL